jgi:hypothetical protein
MILHRCLHWFWPRHYHELIVEYSLRTSKSYSTRWINHLPTRRDERKMIRDIVAEIESYKSISNKNENTLNISL